MKSDQDCRICGGTEWGVEISSIRDWEYGKEGVYRYRRCTQCRIVQIDPFPSIEDLINAYRVDYHGYANASDKGAIYQALGWANDWFFRNRLKRVVPPGAVVLDLGCGTAAFLEQIRSLGAATVEGIDFSEQAAAATARRGIMVFQGVFRDFDRPDGTYDVIFANNYLEHTVDPLAEIIKCKRLLKKGGGLLGEVPNFDSIDRRIFGRFWGGNHVPRHTFQFDPPSLCGLLKRAGFKEVTIDCQLNTAHLALSVQNLLQSRRVDLRSNTALRHGRASYYGMLLLGFLPLNALLWVLGKSGVMKFQASA